MKQLLRIAEEIDAEYEEDLTEQLHSVDQGEDGADTLSIDATAADGDTGGAPIADRTESNDA